MKKETNVAVSPCAKSGKLQGMTQLKTTMAKWVHVDTRDPSHERVPAIKLAKLKLQFLDAIEPWKGLIIKQAVLPFVLMLVTMDVNNPSSG
ncbi:hypothetical protein CJ030_MR1G005694 [Morella rubra]|uniref:Uncharacterized protein n=1 Tax=Morella rubra TaxID=262757 RepID=A0A6A1WVE2_9ROSI|nr:hypothetical protein CJ030_MR1G005694 [Morella rubra]